MCQRSINYCKDPLNCFHKTVSFTLKAQVQATSPRCFRTKEENQKFTKYLSTSVECPTQLCKLHTEITHTTDNRGKRMAIQRSTSKVQSTGVECQGKTSITNKFHHQIIRVTVELVRERKKLNYTITPR